MKSRLWLLGIAGAEAALAAVALVFLLLTILSALLVVVWLGLPLLLVCAVVVRRLATIHRRFTTILVDEPITSPYLRPASGNLIARLRGYARDPATWRDLVWLLVNSTAGLVLGLVGIVEALLDLLFWWLPVATLLRTNALIGQALLSPSRKSELALRVQQLTASRAETVDTQAAEIRRIERDLHDGAQARLVALGMTLGLAEESVEADPANARRLLSEAREANSLALAELRDLVRGIHPPVLADRGLPGALEALAMTTPLPVQMSIAVPTRLPAPVESAAYFAVAESLTNVIKHSAATQAELTVVHEHGQLRMEVRDDGRGGASIQVGAGLDGIERRLAVFDGTLSLSSPSGGPTVVSMIVPCDAAGH